MVHQLEVWQRWGPLTLWDEPHFCAAAGASAEEAEAAKRLHEYTTQLRAGEFVGVAGHPQLADWPHELDEAALDRFISRCRYGYVVDALPRLLHKQMWMYHQVVGTDNVAVDIERGPEGAAGRAPELNPGEVCNHPMAPLSLSLCPR